ncbi:MAG: hypothetical protein HUT38_03210 [Candidatus Paceibacter sp.]|nr:hypothetical protein [Candidatus Paceibacter sp.]
MTFVNPLPKNKKIAVIDFASSSVGAMVIEQNKDGQARIIGSAREPFNFLYDVNFDAFWRCAAGALEKSLKNIGGIISGRPEKILCVFSSPWFVSRSKVINISKSEPFEIKPEFFRQIIAEEEGKMKNARGFFLEHEIIKTELNGYSADSPFGKKAKTVRLGVYLSSAAESVRKNIEKRIISAFGPAPVEYATFPLLAMKVFNGIIKNREDYLVADIGGEVTDVFLIKDKSLAATVSFPKGYNALLRKVASSSNSFVKEAPSLLKSYVAGHRTAESSGNIALAIRESKEEWRSFFGEAVGKIAESGPLPGLVMIIGGGMAKKYFEECVAAGEFSDFTVLGKPMTPREILPEWLEHFFIIGSSGQSGETVHHYKDAALLLESYYANKKL